MSFIQGTKLRDHLNTENFREIAKEMGERIRELHKHDIIHGDLTTSNMIYDDKLYFVDFGLSFVSKKDEDKAVDLHLLTQALESYHTDFWEEAVDIALKAYGDKTVLKRLEIVEKRGRNKH